MAAVSVKRYIPALTRQLAELNSSVTLVNSQLVCLRPVGILNPAMFDLNYLFQMICTAPLA